MKNIFLAFLLTSLIIGGYYVLDAGHFLKQKDFISEKLGIAFDYLSSENKRNYVLETGNKVYVYTDVTQSPEKGQFVEMFYKQSSESFENAIKRVALSNASSEDCKILVDSRNKLDPKGPFVGTIVFPPISDPNNHDWNWGDVKLGTCSLDYEAANGIRYFYYNPKKPERFFFFSIGQYTIETEPGRSWQDTFQVL